MSKYLIKIISEGEHHRQDFKFCISDARKIARTFSAFANSNGGKLLIGVRDNGSVAGVSSDEEYYMVDSAASIYCKPEVIYTSKIHRTDNKTVVEIDIPEGDNKPYLASGEDGRWLAYIRNGDQNLLANKVILNVWKLKKDNRELLIKFSNPETLLIEYLKKNDFISLKEFRSLAGISKQNAEWILARFISMGVLSYDISEEGCRYSPVSKE